MLRGIIVVICLALLAAVTGCSPTETGLSVGWDYQDMDGDGVRNGIDVDVDGDGVLNEHDVYPLNPYAY